MIVKVVYCKKEKKTECEGMLLYFASITQSGRHNCVRYLGMWVSQAQRILFHWFLSDSLYIKLVSICSIAGHENP